MKLDDVLKILRNQDNGQEMVNFLTNHIDELSSRETSAGSQASALKNKLKNVAKALDCTEDDLVQKTKEVLGKLNATTSELETVKGTVEQLSNKATELEIQNKKLAKATALTELTTTAKANKEVLMRLLPDDVEIVKDEDGLKVKPKDKDAMDLSTYVDSNPDLSLFKASIFSIPNEPGSDNTPAPTPGQESAKPPSTGKGSDTPKSGTGDAVKQYQSRYYDVVAKRLAERFNR